VHLGISAIFENFGLEEDSRIANAWRDAFSVDRIEQERWLDDKAGHYEAEQLAYHLDRITVMIR
jgi:hypothetical protein